MEICPCIDKFIIIFSKEINNFTHVRNNNMD